MAAPNEIDFRVCRHPQQPIDPALVRPVRVNFDPSCNLAGSDDHPWRNGTFTVSAQTGSCRRRSLVLVKEARINSHVLRYPLTYVNA
jgi:hypothetical protein